jgi:hypothetical protein
VRSIGKYTHRMFPSPPNFWSPNANFRASRYETKENATHAERREHDPFVRFDAARLHEDEADDEEDPRQPVQRSVDGGETVCGIEPVVHAPPLQQKHFQKVDAQPLRAPSSSVPS